MAAVSDPARLAALRAANVGDFTGDARLQRISRLASALLGTPVSLVSIVEQDRQVFAAQVGLKEPWASRGETPLSHSFCQHVVTDDSALIIPDARRDPRLRDNLAIRDLDVVAYCGVPVRDRDGHVLGSFCVIDDGPRDWTPDEVALLEDLGALVQTELTLGASEPHPDDRRAVAHDLRSVLAGVVGGATTLARYDDLSAKTRELLLGVVTRQAAQLETMVERLIADERPADGVVVVDLTKLLVEVGQEYEAVTDGPTVAVAADPGLRVLGDTGSLRRCLRNLIDNAHRHGGPDVSVEVTAMRHGSVVHVTVKDDGVGVPAADRTRIFERGTRGATSAPGQGIGLSNVLELARSLGGDVILVDSDVGATFVLELRAA